MTLINTSVLMSGVGYFSDDQPINPFMNQQVPIDLAEAEREHNQVQAALESIGVTVQRVDPPTNCQDGVFTANWALVRGDKAVLARLPNARKQEEPYAKQILESLGKTVYILPENSLMFSGQGDALACGNYLFCGTGYRSDVIAQYFVCDTLGFTKVQIQAKPQLDAIGKPVVNQYSGWPDSFYYDLDLAIAVLKPPIYENGIAIEKGLIGFCPEALTPDSVERIRALTDIGLIEVSEEEAVNNLACNLVSTGEHVIMNDAPKFATAIEDHGLRVTKLLCPELAKGGGSVRCITLTLQ